MSMEHLTTVSAWGRAKRAEGMRIDEHFFRDLVSEGRIEGTVIMPDGRIYVPKEKLEAAIPLYERHRIAMRAEKSRRMSEAQKKRSATIVSRLEEIERRLEKLERFI